MDLSKIKISQEWKEILREEFFQPYFSKIKECYIQEREQGKVIFPKGNLIFEAFNRVKPQDLKVVILGQDPYHGFEMIQGQRVSQAMGLSFSVPREVKIPPSLKNIYKELQRSLGINPPNHGDLSSWCDQGVMLLNSVLSVEMGKAGSHRYFGWETFTDSVISHISKSFEGIVFMLWGNYARQKRILIDTNRHCVIESAHPSPLARGFVGSNVFVLANEALRRYGKTPIHWECL